MSRSNPKIENPCKKFIEFKGDKGQLYYYDRENEITVDVPVPLYFIWLDELSTITGYNKKNDCGIWSNEVRKTSTDVLRVKTFKGYESVTGIYNDVKDSIKALGGKYSRSVYGMLVEKDKPGELINLRLHGAAFSSWLDKKFDVNKSVIGITGFRDETNGNVTYKVPVFTPFKLTPELDQEATALDMELQEYLAEYLTQQTEPVVDENTEGVQANDAFIKSARQKLIDKSKAKSQDGYSDLPYDKDIEDRILDGEFIDTNSESPY